MARPHPGRAKRKRGCKLCKPWRQEGNGGRKTNWAKRDPLAIYRHSGNRLKTHDWQPER